MKNFKTIIVVMIALAGAPLTSHGQAGSAAGGMSVGTAVAIGVVGAALLVALGDSSSSAPAAVAAAASDSSAEASTSTTVVQSASSTTTTTTTTTVTNWSKRKYNSEKNGESRFFLLVIDV